MSKTLAIFLLLWSTPASAYYIFHAGGWIWTEEGIWHGPRIGSNSGQCGDDVDLYAVSAEAPSATCEMEPGVLALSVTDPATLAHVRTEMAAIGLLPPVGPALRLVVSGCTYDPVPVCE